MKLINDPKLLKTEFFKQYITLKNWLKFLFLLWKLEANTRKKSNDQNKTLNIISRICDNSTAEVSNTYQINCGNIFTMHTNSHIMYVLSDSIMK